MFLKRFLMITISLLMAMFIVACGNSYTSTGSTSAPTGGASNSSAMIKTANAVVKGKSETILTNTDGKTLYYFTSDTATTSACTGGCINVWPPLLFTGSGSPASSTTLSGTLSVQTDANGNQVEYNGHPLYAYSGDSASGQTNGEGLFGKWFVATPSLASQSGGTSKGYGY